MSAPVSGLVRLAAAAAFLLAAPGAAPGHERHHEGVPERAPKDATSEPGAMSHGDSATAGDHPMHANAEESPPYAIPPLGEALVHHLHNKLVHLPIALAPVAFILLVFDRRRPGLGGAAGVLVWIAAAGAVASYFAGRAQEEVFRGEPKEWLVGVHETWGTVAAITLVAWALLTFWPAARRHLWLWGAAATVAVLAAAFFGGLVAHG